MAYLLDQLLSESAARQCRSLALTCEGHSLTYGELEASSNQFAYALIERGIKPGDRVGIHLPKSLALIISVFGILKAGACYVPVHNSSPARRLAEIALQCAMSCLITNSAAAAKLDVLPYELKTVFLTDWVPGINRPKGPNVLDFYASLVGRPSCVPALARTDQDLAYILFTSGSTGKPKGVMLSHLNAMTFVNWAYETFAIHESDRLSNHAPLNFDLSVFDLFVAAKAGAALILVPDGLSTFPLELRDFIADEKITVWYSVPSVLSLLVTQGQLLDTSFTRLKLILFAGEVFPIKYLRKLMQLVPMARFVNLYGPTETNVCTYYEVDAIPEHTARALPIGRACANTEVIGIDAEGRRLTNPGEEGMLYVRGSSVMQGYYGRTAETDAAFIKNPFAAGREERLYCTGDWVELDASGNYCFLGRKDHMVKTRGYRVELGEIEAALYSHPAITEAAAIPVPDDLLGNRIKAFVVTQEGHRITAQELKRHCGLSLASYMVPDQVEFRNSLPRTSTGKIDRASLQGEAIEFLASRQ
jgi:amino acid adenylation domain-containing protein